MVKGTDGSAATDPTVIVRQARRSTAKLITQNLGRELMDASTGGVNSLLQTTPPKVDIMA